jgi:UDP-glucose 4-epimerase
VANNNIKAVILGHTGFIGNAVRSKFETDEFTQVISFNSKTLDLTQSKAVDELARHLDPSTVLVVAVRPRGHYTASQLSQKDLQIHMNVGEALKRQRALKCIYLSSSAVYGDDKTNLQLAEESPVLPSSFYGYARWAGEVLLKTAATSSKTPIVILRSCMVYGPGDMGAAYGPGKFIRLIQTEKKIMLFGDGEEVRDYIFIDDLAKIIHLLSRENVTGVFNVGTSEAYSFQEIVKLLRELTEIKFEVVHMKRDRPNTSVRMKVEKIGRLFPYLKFTPLREGILKSCEYLAARVS